MKKLGLGILTALVLVSALTGAVFAQAETPTDIPEARLERAAERLGMSVEELQAALDGGQTIQELAEAAGIEMPQRPEGAGPGGERPEGMGGGRSGQIAELLGMTEEELQAALDSGQTIKELAEAAGIELPERPEGAGPGGMGGRSGQIAELLGMTEEELQAALDSGQTIQELAEAAGIELPQRPEGMGGRGGQIAEKLGMTEEELQAALDGGQTIQELADAAGIELPERPEGAGGQRTEGAGPRGGRGE